MLMRGLYSFGCMVFGDTSIADVVSPRFFMEERWIPKIKEVVYIERSGQFPFKRVVSNLIVDVISESVVSAVNYINATHYTSFGFGELQMHSVIIPALANNTDCFILEYPITRRVGRENHFGRVDYYCRCNISKKNEYHLFVELKSNRQALPIKGCYRKENLYLWELAYKQIKGIEQEIKANRKLGFYKEPIVRACVESLILYADESKEITDESVLESIKIAKSNFTIGERLIPNLIVLWKCSNRIFDIAQDEWFPKRKMYGIIFICHIMEPIPADI